ncbi:hypothetical protein HG536_0C01070 [Torulaspora globosa]|uniref:Diphthine--ammonia ligase n=1 Tax=Torulaspora globosa TaxID=48254 RepID=A0A7G3ZEK4_9SACH|nr:uncharacterized protein HG536_0C01070 [Torulaspora globosa]QLL31940.1 hypothetical protein HG536_0C01070 [Torulaspora globosa]
MKFVALVSGGKDSCFNVLHCLKQGHVLVAFANLHPADETKQELDSYMFQTVGHDVVSHYDRCAGIPLFRQEITHGSSRNLEMNYTPTRKDEIEDLHFLLAKIKKEIPEVEAVSVGAILSSYQRTRVEDVCRRLDLTVLSYLWQRDQLELMSEMCSMSKATDTGASDGLNMDARIIKVAAVGLDQSHLNMSLPQIFPIMKRLNRMYEVHICGEGGEFETMVLDAPFFVNGSLELVSQTVNNSDESNGVYSTQFEVVFKPKNTSPDMKEALRKLPVPPLLDDKWAFLLAMMKNFENKEVREQRNLDTPEDSLANPEISIVQAQGLLYISNLKGNSALASVEEQTQQVLDQLDSIMNKMGVEPSRAMSCSLVLQSMSDFSAVNSIYNRFFDISRHGPLPPSRACVESKSLGKNCLLQLSIVFDMAGSVKRLANDIIICPNKNGLHVQGRSYWAPCNIGPYSQAIWLNSDKNRISFLSGQIPLIPSSMEMISREPVLQGVLSLRHFDTIKTTIDAKKQLFMTCFVTSDLMVPIVSQIWSLYCGGMQYESELWMDKEDDPVRSLIIVKISGLPRNALCEWSGVACRELSVVDPVEDEDIQDLKSISHVKVQAKGSCVVSTVEVTNGQAQIQFTTGFADCLEDLKIFMNSINSRYKATLYFNPSDTQDFPAIANTEFLPVERIFDCNGTAHKFGFHLTV